MNCILSQRKSVKSINDMFRENYGQAQESIKKGNKKPNRGYKSTPSKKGVDDYNSRDILSIYKHLAEKNGYKFYSNQSSDIRYMKNIKQIMETFDNEAIIDMYKFLFESGQTYLDMRKCTPAILLTGWCNRIVADTQDYLDGTFKNSTRPVREYEGDEDEESTIGEWE